MGSKTLVLTGASAVLPQGAVAHASFEISRGQLQRVQKDAPAGKLLAQDDVDWIELSSDTILTPGLIDLQLNGCHGTDFASGSIAEVQQALSLLPQSGTTRLLATLVSAPMVDLLGSLNTLEEVVHLPQTQQSRLLGFHLEGPFLNPQRAGTHPVEGLQTIDLEALEPLLSPSVKLMTLAPELEQAPALMERLNQKGIRFWAGHTQANASQLEVALERGLAGVTHLFNAMEGFHHRQPGTALHVLNDDRLLAALIADGEHIHPEMLRLVVKVKGVERLLLTSDALPLAGCPEGAQARFAGQWVYRQQAKAVNEQGGLAGSLQLLDEAIRNCVRWKLCSFTQAVQMATLNPARVLGLEAEHGQLVEGARADLVLWDKRSLDILACWVDGELVWCKPNSALAKNKAQPTEEASNPLQAQLSSMSG
jgi:N-acetylglucosamine-6-phosphate deacetylase